MGRENHRLVSSLPQQPPITSARKSRFIVSWWEREVHIWILRKSANDIVTDEFRDQNLDQNRKLLKTVVVKGESNISSATINPEGTLLVVSTATDVKAFRLSHSSPAKPSDVKIVTAQLPAKLTSSGACHVQVSPDSRWLTSIQDGSRVLVAKVDTSDEDTIISPRNVFRLARIKRDIPNYIKSGGLGNYDRNIVRVAFSPDSKMLAAADIAGYVDTWILRGHGEREQRDVEGGQADASSSESEDSDSDQESIDPESELWIRNPNGKRLPKLPSTPVILSFSGEVPDADEDYSLLVITSAWNLLVFHPLAGSLTPWTRRHPHKSLPAPIRDLMDVPKGAVWQGSRVWIYGVSFLVMIDFSRDLPTPAPASGTEVVPAHAGTKRKRHGFRSGAGGKMDKTLAPHLVHKHTGGLREKMDLDDAKPGDASNSDDDEAGQVERGELTQLRQAKLGDTTSMDLVETGAETEKKSWWMTYKYRPIFGVVPLGEDEVALVERPMWDVEMPDRYFAGEEWERR